jgi:hypothetical protein
LLIAYRAKFSVVRKAKKKLRLNAVTYFISQYGFFEYFRLFGLSQSVGERNHRSIGGYLIVLDTLGGTD